MFRKVFYTGSNEKAAAYSGIRTKRVVFLTTTLCSTLCGVAGIIYMARFGSAQPTFGVGMELNVIAAAVIGGASLSGGQGTIFGAILGAILLSVVSSSLALLDVSVYWQDIIRGSILLAAVTFDHYLQQAQGAVRARWRSHELTIQRLRGRSRQIYTRAGAAFHRGHASRPRSPSTLNLSHVQGQPPDHAGPRAGHGQDRDREPVPARWSTSRTRLPRGDRARKRCVVTPTRLGQSATPSCSRSARAAANQLLETLRDGDVIAITGGKAVSAVVENAGAGAHASTSTVVPLTGGVQGKHYTDVNHLATQMAEQARRHGAC